MRSIVIADTGVIISLAALDKLNILEEFFKEIYIPEAVWNELLSLNQFPHLEEIKRFFKQRVIKITSSNNLILLMDFGESESVLLYKELKADLLLIDDKHARTIAESLGVACIGTLGLLIVAKQRGTIKELKPLFNKLIMNKRYYSKKLLNEILKESNEEVL
jgi:hypothetical protein